MPLAGDDEFSAPPRRRGPATGAATTPSTGAAVTPAAEPIDPATEPKPAAVTVVGMPAIDPATLVAPLPEVHEDPAGDAARELAEVKLLVEPILAGTHTAYELLPTGERAGLRRRIETLATSVVLDAEGWDLLKRWQEELQRFDDMISLDEVCQSDHTRFVRGDLELIMTETLAEILARFEANQPYFDQVYGWYGQEHARKILENIRREVEERTGSVSTATSGRVDPPETIQVGDGLDQAVPFNPFAQAPRAITPAQPLQSAAGMPSATPTFPPAMPGQRPQGAVEVRPTVVVATPKCPECGAVSTANFRLCATCEHKRGAQPAGPSSPTMQLGQPLGQPRPQEPRLFRDEAPSQPPPRPKDVIKGSGRKAWSAATWATIGALALLVSFVGAAWMLVNYKTSPTTRTTTTTPTRVTPPTRTTPRPPPAPVAPPPQEEPAPPTEDPTRPTCLDSGPNLVSGECCIHASERAGVDATQFRQDPTYRGHGHYVCRSRAAARNRHSDTYNVSMCNWCEPR